MRLVRGSRSGGTFGGRPDARAGIALALTFSVASACGGRTLEYDAANSGGEGNDSSLGGSVGGAKPGTGGQGGTNSGSGGSVTAGVTGGGVSGSQPVTGGGPTTGGTEATGGGSTTGGVAGSVAGSAPAAGGVSMTGGRGGSGASPGRGSGGRAGSPGRGAGGSAGAPGQGGTGTGAGGAGGVAGQAGGGGSPAVYEACKRACTNVPATCAATGGGTPAECMDSCPDLSTYSAACSLELADYLNCVGDGMNPGAACMQTDAGECYGPGCTSTAIAYCASMLEVFSSCTLGCDTGYSVGPDGCSYARYCVTHEYDSRCTPDGSGGWFCVCSIDGVDTAKGVLYGDVSQVCSNADTLCYFAR